MFVTDKNAHIAYIAILITKLNWGLEINFCNYLKLWPGLLLENVKSVLQIVICYQYFSINDMKLNRTGACCAVIP